jgi:hypothetical protein
LVCLLDGQTWREIPRPTKRHTQVYDVAKSRQQLKPTAKRTVNVRINQAKQ